MQLEKELRWRAHKDIFGERHDLFSLVADGVGGGCCNFKKKHLLSSFGDLIHSCLLTGFSTSWMAHVLSQSFQQTNCFAHHVFLKFSWENCFVNMSFIGEGRVNLTWAFSVTKAKLRLVPFAVLAEKYRQVIWTHRTLSWGFFRQFFRWHGKNLILKKLKIN